MGIKQAIIHPFVRRLQWWMQEVEMQQGPPQADLDNGYNFLRYGFWHLMQDETARRKPMYAWGVLQGSARSSSEWLERTDCWRWIASPDLQSG
jgi:hypothetical protein